MVPVVLAAVITTSPSPSPSPTALPVITTVRVATGSPQSLHQLPVAASLMDSQAIHSIGATTGDALLGNLPGFDRNRSNSNFTNYGLDRVSFSGAGNDRGLVLVDGVPAQDGFGGQVDWTLYPASDIERAELLRGPGSALYGSNAIGGVLSIDTFGPSSVQPTQTSGAVTFAAGTPQVLRNYARVDVPIGSRLQATLSAQQGQMSYLDLAPGYTSPIDKPAVSQTSMASFRLQYAASNTLTFQYGYRGGWDYQMEGRPNYDFWRRLYQQSFGFANTTSHTQLSVLSYVREAEVTNVDDMAPTVPGALRYTQYVPTNESGVSVNWISSGERSQFTARADERAVDGVSTQYGPTNAFQSGGNGAQQLGGLALQETLNWSRAELVMGARADEVSLLRGSLLTPATTTAVAANTQRAISPRIAARYDLTKHLAFRVSEGSGFRAPFLNELVRGYQIGSIAYKPNPSLLPERSSSLTGGFDWTLGRTHVALDGFHTFVNDAIAFQTVNATTQMRTNFAHTRTDGETLTITNDLSRVSRMTFFATGQNARVTSGIPADIGKQLAYIPNAEAGASFDTQVANVGAGVSLTYSGQTYADDLNTEPLGSALLVGAHVSVPLHDEARLTVDVENATDRRYLSSIDRYAPPATVTVGITVPVAASH